MTIRKTAIFGIICQGKNFIFHQIDNASFMPQKLPGGRTSAAQGHIECRDLTIVLIVQIFYLFEPS